MAPDRPDLNREFDRLQRHLPRRSAAMLRWVRRPSSGWVRVPAGVLLIAGGVLSFLPVLGIWMLPLGLGLIAQDVPPLRPPMARGLAWGLDKWEKRQRRD